jgi:hypothetical protein
MLVNHLKLHCKTAVSRFDIQKEEDENGLEEAAIKLYDDAEIVFINRDNYKGLRNQVSVNQFRILRLSEDTGQNR